MEKEKIILAFSGGLDTSYCCLFLSKVKNYEVHAVTINTGGFTELDCKELETKAITCGASSFTFIDVLDDYYKQCVKYLIFGNVLKNGNYPLSVSAERVIQSKTIAEFAKQKGISNIAHGSTSAGNDQIRFDMNIRNSLPSVNIVTPIRDQNISREEEISFLKLHGINFSDISSAYSINKGLWGTSVGGKETLTSKNYLPDSAWPTPLNYQKDLNIQLNFYKGELIKVNNLSFDKKVDAIQFLQNLAQPFGIGRDIHVGDTIIGIKGRVGFEAAAPILIIKSHALLEKHVLTKHQIFWKEQLSTWYGNWLHEGHLQDPVMRDIEKFFENTQEYVTGTVFITLQNQRFTLNGIESPYDLMDEKFGSYGEVNDAWTGDDAAGFARIAGYQTSIFQKVHEML